MQVPDQKVRGHFPFPFHFDFTPLNYFKPLIFQSSAEREKNSIRYQKSQVYNLSIGNNGEGDAGEVWVLGRTMGWGCG